MKTPRTDVVEHGFSSFLFCAADSLFVGFKRGIGAWGGVCGAQLGPVAFQPETESVEKIMKLYFHQKKPHKEHAMMSRPINDRK